jgi:hypothetical protein
MPVVRPRFAALTKDDQTRAGRISAGSLRIQGHCLREAQLGDGQSTYCALSGNAGPDASKLGCIRPRPMHPEPDDLYSMRRWRPAQQIEAHIRRPLDSEEGDRRRPDVAQSEGASRAILLSPVQRLPYAEHAAEVPEESIPDLQAFPTESPQVRVRGAAPHTKPTDKTAFPGTWRHGCYHGPTTPDGPLCRQCRAGAVDSSRGPGGYRPSCKRQVSGSNPLTGSQSP